MNSSPSMLHIRAAHPHESYALHALFASAIHTRAQASYTPAQLDAWSHARDTRGFLFDIMRLGKHFLVAEQHGTLHGFGAVEKDCIVLLYAHPEAPHGTGSQLLQALEGIAAAEGTTTLTLTSSLNAEGFYRAHGYEAHHRDTVQRGGQRLSTVQMSKSLTTA